MSKNCCDYGCDGSPGCIAGQSKKPTCPPCTHDCNQSRTCSARASKLIQKNSDGSDAGLPAMTFSGVWQWLRDLFYAAIYIGGPVFLGALLALALMFATGLHRAIF